MEKKSVIQQEFDIQCFSIQDSIYNTLQVRTDTVIANDPACSVTEVFR